LQHAVHRRATTVGEAALAAAVNQNVAVIAVVAHKGRAGLGIVWMAKEEVTLGVIAATATADLVAFAVTQFAHAVDIPVIPLALGNIPQRLKRANSSLGNQTKNFLYL
jgi:lauroyl/myristoyl acyltransferase